MGLLSTEIKWGIRISGLNGKGRENLIQARQHFHMKQDRITYPIVHCLNEVILSRYVIKQCC